MTRPAMTKAPLVAFFPEASFGAALNCVGIAREVRDAGARPVFICHPGFHGVFAEYGFPEYHLAAGELSDDGRQRYWDAFVERHGDSFRLPPIEQIDAYVVPTWEAIVDTAVAVEAPLRQLLARLKPDVVVLDNVVMFPAVAAAGVPWVRVVSCAEAEIDDPALPPAFSGCRADDTAGHAAFRARYRAAVAPVHERYNRFRAGAGLAALPDTEFLEPSPWLNLLLAPAAVRLARSRPLDPPRFLFLDGCVRSEGPFVAPTFPRHDDAPLVLSSFGSLGAMDVALIERMIGVFSRLPYRFLVNVGAWGDAYRQVPDNVCLGAWFPQPSVVAESRLFIHHGGNNSFCEALHFGVPSLVMPYCWDGHDNAARAEEAGVGLRLDRYGWTDGELAAAVVGLAEDGAMRRRLALIGDRMRAAHGARQAAEAILRVAG
jgi:MGT family glycosyltransferase